MDTKQQPQTRNWLRSPAFLVLCGFLIIAAFFLLTEHRAHVFGILPFVLLICPYTFLHGRRGHGSDVGHAVADGKSAIRPNNEFLPIAGLGSW
jgi:hypothetical protein